MSEENNLKEEPKFSSQQFLLSHIDDIMSNIQPSYKNIYQLDTTTKSLPEILALLNGKSDSIPFTKLETHQNAALIPKIRLYRVEPSTNGDQEVELEYIFYKDSRFGYVNDNILGGNYIKGDNAGIKSFNWTFAGTNPVTAQNCIEVSMELFFDSLAAFSGGYYDGMLELWKNAPEDANAFRNSSPFDDYERLITSNYWALVYHPAFKKNRDGYDSIYYRTKVVVGWNDIEPSIKNELFKHPKFANIQDDIEDMNISMYLNLVSHNFTFNEDGTIKLKLDYKGSLENSLFSAKNNLFVDKFGFTLKEALERLKQTNVEQLVFGSEDQGIVAARFFGATEKGRSLSYNQQNSRLKILSYLRDNQDLNKLKGELNTCGVDTRILAELQPLLDNPDSLKSIIEGEQKMLDVIEKNLQTAEISIKNQYYSRLTKELFVSENKIYKLSLNKDQVEEWIKWKKTQTDIEVPQITINNSSFASSSDIDTITKSIDEIKSFSSSIIGNKPDKFFELTNTYKEKEESIEEKIIYFTTVGHLLDTAYEISIKLNLNNKDNTYNKIILSNFADHELDSSQQKPSFILKSIANIPVDLNLYLNHMIEEVYKSLKDTYTFYQFLKDIIVKIVEPAISQQDANDNNINKYANTSLATTILSLQSGPNSTKDPLDNFSNNQQKIIDLKGQTRSTFKNYLIKGNNSKGSKYYNYYFIYDKYLKDFKGIGEQLEDERKGIYHYTVAQSYGLIKSITFKKVDQPYLREAKSVGKKTLFLGQFRDIYAADIKMVGNNIYNNGMLLFLKPSVEFGKVIGTPENPSFSQLTGVGGYYSVIKVENSITENGYETNLTCLFHSNDGFAPEGNKSCSQEELQKAGLIQENGLINPELQEVLSLLEEQNKKTQEEEVETNKIKTRTTRLEAGKI